jgi:hypothetical protein
MEDGRYGKIYSDKLTREFLIDEYINKQKGPYIIAEDVGCSPKIVYNYLDYHNIPRRKCTGEINAGSNFGWLTTIKIVGKSKNGTKLWLCQCECGNTVEIPTSRLKNGRAKSCGCYRKRKKNHRWRGYCDVSGRLIGEIRHRARKKQFDFDLTAQFLWEKLQNQNSKCAISGLDISLDKNASVDRIDSSKGYVTTNVWWVHKDVNKMKMDLSLDYFLKMCKIIAQNKEPK